MAMTQTGSLPATACRVTTAAGSSVTTAARVSSATSGRQDGSLARKLKMSAMPAPESTRSNETRP